MAPMAAPPTALVAAPLAPEGGATTGLEEMPGTQLIKSPMVGTFYRRPSPDSEPYVDVGTTVDAESVICIVEAMKVNNEIKAEIQRRDRRDPGRGRSAGGVRRSRSSA